MQMGLLSPAKSRCHYTYSERALVARGEKSKEYIYFENNMKHHPRFVFDTKWSSTKHTNTRAHKQTKGPHGPSF